MKKYSVKQKRTLIVSLIIIFAISIGITVCENFNIISWKNVFNLAGVSDFTSESDRYDMSVHFIDVGKADSIYIKCKDKNILIDAGEKNTYDLVNEYLRRQNVKVLDLVIATHPHTDHIGGMPKVIEEFKINKLLMPELKEEVIPTSRTYEKFLLAIKNKNIAPERPIPGTSFNVGELIFEVLAPNKQYDDVNNNSIVVKMTFKNTSFLFTGDAEKESENDMMNNNFNLEADVLKVGHHGSKTSTSSAFLKKVNPKYAVICVGEDRYNLPKKITIDKLTKRNIKVFRTDCNGTVVFSTDGNKISVFTEKE